MLRILACCYKKRGLSLRGLAILFDGIILSRFCTLFRFSLVTYQIVIKDVSVTFSQKPSGCIMFIILLVYNLIRLIGDVSLIICNSAMMMSMFDNYMQTDTADGMLVTATALVEDAFG